MAKAVYPGSFDPITLGHLDVIRRAARATDELIIGILRNTKKEPLFSLEERKSMIEDCVKDIDNVTVKVFDGMTVDFARENDANIIVRGLRAVSDFEYEMQMAQTNHTIDPQVDTIFFTTSLEYAFLSSTIVKEVGYYGKDVSHYVPEPVVRKLREKFSDGILK
ncbi:MAG TPA: pantetheine-phosphate adenylyltransferase [Lachnospiraceae bacterium]|nr:pantetheine-phosphate adenylyltransferase [Lachnospiraceae bacterium]